LVPSPGPIGSWDATAARPFTAGDEDGFEIGDLTLVELDADAYLAASGSS